MTGTATRLIAHLPTLLDIISNDKVGRGDRCTWALALSSLRVRHVRYASAETVHFSCDMGKYSTCAVFSHIARTMNNVCIFIVTLERSALA